MPSLLGRRGEGVLALEGDLAEEEPLSEREQPDDRAVVGFGARATTHWSDRLRDEAGP